MTETSLLGKISSYDPMTNKVVLDLSFVSLEKWERIENALNENITFKFTKPNKRLKSHAQLKKYFRNIKLILQKFGVDVSSQTATELDRHLKTSLVECDTLTFNEEVNGKMTEVNIPLIPSKATMSIEAMSKFIQDVEDTYSYLDIDWDS